MASLLFNQCWERSQSLSDTVQIIILQCAIPGKLKNLYFGLKTPETQYPPLMGDL